MEKAINNFDVLWKDHEISDPTKGKFVRSARRELRSFLDKMNKTLACFDKNLPDFMFAVKGRSHKKAAKKLQGRNKKRSLLKLDLSRFFEQNTHEKVSKFFSKKFGCNREMSELIAELTCVQNGSKQDPAKGASLARGFAPSTRIAAWVNLDFFLHLKKIVLKRLRGHDPQMTVYVDDIGITASRISKQELEDLKIEILKLAKKYNLEINPKKTEIIMDNERKEYLGITLGKRGLTPSAKTNSKKRSIHNNIRYSKSLKEKSKWKNKLNSYKHYEDYVKSKVIDF